LMPTWGFSAVSTVKTESGGVHARVPLADEWLPRFLPRKPGQALH
jgi:hypothetical protein